VRGTALLIAGMLLQSPTGLDPPDALLLALAAFTAAGFQELAARRRVRRLPRVFLALGLVSAGAARMGTAGALPPDDLSLFLDGSPVTLTGVVAGEPEARRHSLRFTLSCRSREKSGARQPVSGLLQARFHGDVAAIRDRVRYGHLLAVDCVPAPPADAGNPAGFREAQHLSRQGIRAVARLYDPAAIKLLEPGRGNFPAAAALRARERLRKLIEYSLPGPGGSTGSIGAVILRGILLGDRSELPAALKNAFREAGVLHTLVVSGLHVGFIWLLGSLALSALSLRRRHACLIALVLAYVFITGARPPAVRAGLMASIYSLGYVLKEPPHPWTALAAAAGVILLCRPLEIFQAGFQLSFLIVAAIIALAPRFEQALAKFPGPLRRLLSVLLAAQLGVLPLSALYFQEIHPWALAANFVIVPLVGVCAGLGFLAVLAGLVRPEAALLINYPNRFLLQVLLRLVEFSSGLPGASVPVGRFPAAWFLGLYLALLLGSRSFRARGKIPLLLAGITLAGALAYPFLRDSPNRPGAVFFNGPGGEFVLLAGERGTVLAGPDADPFGEVEKIVLPELARRGIGKLDLVLLTRESPDRLDTLKKLLAQVRVNSVATAAGEGKSVTGAAFLRFLEVENIPLRRVRRGDILEAGEMELAVLWPPEGPFPPDGKGTAAFQTRIGGVAILIPGEIGPLAQEQLVRFRGLPEAALVKLPKKGKTAEVADAFLNSLNPRWAVIQQGQPHFGRYARDCGQKLEKRAIPVYRSSVHGAVTLCAGPEPLIMTGLEPRRTDFPVWSDDDDD